MFDGNWLKQLLLIKLNQHIKSMSLNGLLVLQLTTQIDIILHYEEVPKLERTYIFDGHQNPGSNISILVDFQ